MGLPGGKDVVLPRHRQHVGRHTGAEALDLPGLRAVEAELAIKLLRADLRRHLQKQHAGEAPAVCMGGVVVAGALHIEPQINHLQGVLAGIPGATALGWLLIDHLTDPVLTGGQDHVPAEGDDARGIRGELPLLEQLAGQAGRGVRAGFGGCRDPRRQVLQVPEQAGVDPTTQHMAGKQTENLQCRLRGQRRAKAKAAATARRNQTAT